MIMSENIALIVAIIVLMPYMVRHIICVSVMDFTISNTLGLSLITKDVYEEKKTKPKNYLRHCIAVTNYFSSVLYKCSTLDASVHVF